eukprot:jgi/Bigna1/137791/aug1.41_g12499
MHNTTPVQRADLKTFLQDPRPLAVGKNLGGDVSKLRDDWQINVPFRKSVQELGKRARERETVTDGKAGLQELVEKSLHLHLPKPESTRLGNWRGKLSAKAIKCAAMDSVASVLVHAAMLSKPDLKARLKPESHRQAGKAVELVDPASNRMAAVGVVKHAVLGQQWDPHGTMCGTTASRRTRATISKTRVLVKLSEVKLRNCKLPINPVTKKVGNCKEKQDASSLQKNDGKWKDILWPWKWTRPLQTSHHTELDSIVDVAVVRTEIRPDPGDAKTRRVKSDLFHPMDRPHLARNHGAVSACHKDMREAMFVRVKSNEENVIAHLTGMGCSERKMKRILRNFGSRWLSKRVRRCVPKCDVLFEWANKVHMQCRDVLDKKTKKPLFNDAARKKMDEVPKLLKDGHGTDPEIPLHCRIGTCKGSGLPLWRCARGTNSVEGVHQKTTKLFRGANLSVQLADCILRDFVHHHNTGVGSKNRSLPNFGHTQVWVEERTQPLCMELFGKPKWNGWCVSQNFVNTGERSTLAPLHMDEAEVLNRDVVERNLSRRLEDVKLPFSMKFISIRLGLSMPPRKLNGPREMKLCNDLLPEDDVNLSESGADWANMQRHWMLHINCKDVWPKTRTQLRQHFVSLEARQKQ